VKDPAGEHGLPDGFKGSPSGYFVVVPNREQKEEYISFAELVSLCARSWKLLLACTMLAALIAAGISFLMHDTFRAEAIVAPVDEGNSVGSGIGHALGGQLGGLAALAGVQLGSSGGRRDADFATLASPGFARDFIVSRNLLPVLFADRWDPAVKAWRGSQPAPKLEDAVRKFTQHVRSIAEDKKTGMVTVTVEWTSPELAANWANGMIDMANERLRGEAMHNAEQSIEYLNRELAKPGLVDLHQAISQLIENQVNTAMVANVQHEYAFRFIDRAVAPEYRVSPRRTVITLVGAVLGLFAGFVGILIRRSVDEMRRAPRR
jgi:LPS O-antigen subunit length determinant protein (WzzB/FepE family)